MTERPPRSWSIDPNDVLFGIGFFVFVAGLMYVAPRLVVPGVGAVLMLVGTVRAK